MTAGGLHATAFELFCKYVSPGAKVLDLGSGAGACAREYVTWDGKAQMVAEILCWATRQGRSPILRPKDAALTPSEQQNDSFAGCEYSVKVKTGRVK